MKIYSNSYKLVFLIMSFIWTSYCSAQDYILFAGNASKGLAQQVAKKLDIEIGSAEINRFNDGEISIKINESVRDKDAYIVQSIAKSETNSVNDNLMELYLLIRTLKRASAGKITAIIPYYGYARQDRKMESRVPISASDVAVLLENSGVDRVVAIDLHAGQIQGFFHNVPVDNIYGSIFMAPEISKLELINPVIVSPDAGGVARAKKFRDALAMYGVEADIAMIIKQRAKAGVVSSADLIGDVKNRDAIIVDDICDTGGTLVKAAEELKKFGAKKVYASITHPVFSNDAINKIENSYFDQVFVSNSIYIPSNQHKKITTISIAPILAMIVENLDHGQSLSNLFVPTMTYTQQYGLSRIIKAAEVFPDFKTTAKLKIKDRNSEFIVTSTNELKIKAVENMLGVKKARGYKTQSSVSEQPIGIKMARAGAKNRIADLKKYNMELEGKYIVSIESFFTELKIGTKPTDHALVLIKTPEGKIFEYISPGVEIDSEIYKSALSRNNVTIGNVMAERYAVDPSNWHAYVTDNKIDRMQQIIQAYQG